MKRTSGKRWISLVLALCLCLLVGCGGKQTGYDPLKGVETRMITDSAGRQVELPAEITRIAPSGSTAQMILMPVAYDLLVGLSSSPSTAQMSYFPEEMRDLPTFGQFYGSKANLNMEALIDAEPQLIVDLGDAKENVRGDMDGIQKQTGITFVFVTHDQEEALSMSDTVVVMSEGKIQQIGTPQEVFDHPANLFVAGFIGTPQMNLFDAHLARKDGKYTVTVGSVTVELSEEKQQRLAAKDVAEQDVVLGVRPDHIMLCADGVKGKVDVSEMMGSSVHLHVAAEGKDVIVIVPTNGAAAHFPAGSEVNMIFGGNVAHVFSKETEKNLEW